MRAAMRDDGHPVAESTSYDARGKIGRDLVGALYPDFAELSIEDKQKVERSGIHEVDAQLDKMQFEHVLRETSMYERWKKCSE